MLRPHVGELEISLRAIYDRFVAAAAQLPQPVVSDNGASSQPASSSSNGDLAEIDVNESLTTDSDFDFEDLTLQWPWPTHWSNTVVQFVIYQNLGKACLQCLGYHKHSQALRWFPPSSTYQIHLILQVFLTIR